ncbi:MAG TPA: sugar phosphate isomerase/epimerase [Armatimonadaceae bacterium]|nr:sugar phosphate isomerase/epimerase [Armatimonadaceae bacterium]
MAAKPPVALQMYTVRDDASRDFPGTLARIARIGYAAVELGGYPGRDPAEVRRLLDENGLAAAGAHSGIDVLENALPEAIAYVHALGTSFLTCPYLPEERRRTIDDYRAVGRVLRAAGERAADEGVTLSYHHHAFEFETRGEDGQYGLDALLDAAGPSVGLELDTFWVAKGGEDPAAYLRRYAGRVHLVHLKDMTAGVERTFAEVGEGTLDWPAIFAAAEAPGGAVRYYIVEQDHCYGRTPLESAAVSFDHLRAWGRA